MKQIVFPFICLLLAPSTVLRGNGLIAENLRCEYHVDPEGIDIRIPRLSWTLASSENGQKQTAYRILAASSHALLSEDIGDLWDSDKVVSDKTIHIPYTGQTLISRMNVWWKIMVWDRYGIPSDWSMIATWSMGLLDETDWEAQWIADPPTVHNARHPLFGYMSEPVEDPDAVQWVGINFRQNPRFDAVRLYPARPADTAGFLFPVRFRIEAANRGDFSDAVVLVDRTGDDESNPGIHPRTYSFPPISRRLVRLVVTRQAGLDGNTYAFALAEMEVLDNDRNIAYENAVISSDFWETGPWARINLTDGFTETVNPGNAIPASLFRREFSLPGTVRKATAYVTALGLYELRINGQRVGDRLLAPEWTNYGRRVAYQTYDVTALLSQDRNAVAAMLGEGWYAGRFMWVGRFPYGNHPRFLLQLEIELEDGTRRTVVSDDSWRSTSNGPIRTAGIYDGETYDARLEQDGWVRPGFDDRHWNTARSYNLDSRRLVWLRNEPIRVEKELKSLVMSEPAPGVFIFDLGQNMVGWCRIEAEGSSGQTVTIRHGEAINDDGTLYTANLRSALQTDLYIPKSDGPFVYEPRFTYHGFRYVELTGLASPPDPGSVTGCVFHSSSPFTGSFECSDPSLNRLMENIQWTQRGNLMSSPTDCPQRDERMGWLGDFQAFAQTAAFNMDMAAFFTKFLQDTRDDQTHDGRFPAYAPFPGEENKPSTGAPAWSDAGVFVPWTAYLNYADTALLEEQYPAACRWISYIHRNNPDLVWRKGLNHDYNDWLNGDRIDHEGWPRSGGEVPREVFATAFFYRSTRLVANMAEILGRTGDALYYSELADRIKDAFNAGFVGPGGRIQGNTQAGYALALDFNLLPDTLIPKAIQHLAENIQEQYGGHLSTGIQTTHRALLALSDGGYDQLAWQLITDRSFPSWLYMIDNGATTIWERWDGYVKGRGFQDPGMNSLNHWAFGAAGEWMWRNIIGLHPDENHPGWKHFTLAPKPGGGVKWARGEYMSIRGRIACQWEIKNGEIHLDAVVPPNTEATILVPTDDAGRIKEKGRKLDPSSVENGFAIFHTGSGRYQFISPYSD